MNYDLYQIATAYHDGQTDKSGEPYYHHVLRVARAVEPQTEEYRLAGVLHDVIEDTEAEREDLLFEGYPVEVVDAVETVSRRDDETYAEFIDRIIASGDRMAIAVKIADVKDHLIDTTHIKDSLKARYVKALDKLVAA